MSDAEQPPAKVPPHHHTEGLPYPVRPKLAEWAAEPQAQQLLGFQWPESESGHPTESVNLETLVSLMQAKLESLQTQVTQNQGEIRLLWSKPQDAHIHQHAGNPAPAQPEVPPLGPTTAELFGECCHKHDENDDCPHSAMHR